MIKLGRWEIVELDNGRWQAKSLRTTVEHGDYLELIEILNSLGE